MTDEEFLIAFQTGELSPHEFDHRAHLRAAWLMLQRYAIETATEKTCDGIENLAKCFGAENKFHRTLSEAVIRLMSQAGARRSDSFEGYLHANPWLIGDVRGVLAQYYSQSQLHSEAAKRSFVSPDLKPLP